MKQNGHSSGNGRQAKMLGRELRRAAREAMRGEAARFADRIDRAVGLADREVGVGTRSRDDINSNVVATDVGANARVPRPAAIQRLESLFPTSGGLAPVADPDPGKQPNAPIPGVYGVPGTPITSGFLGDLGEYNAELMGRSAIPTYEKMRRGDAQVRATLAACKLPCLSAKWDVVPYEGPRARGVGAERRAREVADFVRDNLFGGLEFRRSTGGWVSQSWGDVVRNALLMLDFGCAAHEDVWTVDGPHIRLRRMASRLPLTFYRWHTEPDGETLVALEQYGYRRGRFMTVLLPADKCSIFTYQQEGANFWGIALQRPMYPHWYVKNQLYRIDAIACERNSLGIPVFKLPPGFSKEDQQTAYSFVTQLAAHEATGMVEPPGDPSTGLRIVGYEGRVRDLAPSIQHHNVMISRAALALFMDLGQSDHGSKALGKEHGSFFLLALQNLADQIAEELTRSTVRRLAEFNFGENAPYPRVVAANVQARGLEDIVDALTQFAQTGLVVSEDNLRNFIRKEFALPPEGEEGVVAVRGETVDEGAAASAVAGKSGGSIESASKTE